MNLNIDGVVISITMGWRQFRRHCIPSQNIRSMEILLRLPKIPRTWTEDFGACYVKILLHLAIKERIRGLRGSDLILFSWSIRGFFNCRWCIVGPQHIAQLERCADICNSAEESGGFTWSRDGGKTSDQDAVVRDCLWCGAPDGRVMMSVRKMRELLNRGR